MNPHWRKGKLSGKFIGLSSEMSQQVKALATTPDNLSSMPDTRAVDRRRQTAGVIF